ncbi:hypothetical protein BHM03_00053118, partial [Ensete ventricosum]
MLYRSADRSLPDGTTKINCRRSISVDFGHRRSIEGGIDRQRSIEGEKGKKKKRKRRKKKKRRRRVPLAVLAREPSSQARR